MPDNPRPLLKMRDIVVVFSKVRILERAWVRVGAVEIHALLGENGAGKSSLMKKPRRSRSSIMRR